MKIFTKASDQRERTKANRAKARIGWRPCRPVQRRFNTILGWVLGAGLATVSFCAALGQGYGPTDASNGVMPYAPVSPAPANRDMTISGGPSSPTAPMQSVRPASWPGAAPPVAPQQYPMRSPTPYAQGSALPAMGELKPCESAQIIARVGNDVILTSDVFLGIDELMTRFKEKIPEDQMETQRQQVVQEVTAGVRQLLDHINDADPGMAVDPQRRAIIMTLLRTQIETKLIFQDFRRTIPNESMPNIEQSIGRQFEQTELKTLLKKEKVQSNQELETRLRSRGSSLEREKRIFMEQIIRQQWVREQIKVDKEVTHEQMLTWYQGHLADFEKPARARWEELMASFTKYPSSEAAYAALAQMGNQILGGAPLTEVAKAQSNGPTASQGGLRDWTSKGSLVSEEMDRNLFGLPVGQLSPILQGPTGYHIIRVVERQERTRTPFLEAQKEIREKIHQDRVRKQYTEYVTKVQKLYPVWTVFDNVMKKAAPSAAEEPSRY